MRIGINCGHTVSGQPGCGAVGYIDESVETRRVGKSLTELLRRAGHTVVDCTNDYAKSTNENLSEIVRLANAQTLDLFVSIHFNAGGGKGSEIYTYGAKGFSEVENSLMALTALGFVNRGIKDGSDLYVIRRTSAAAMLVEVCFVDNKTDCEHYMELGPDVIAQAICRGITGGVPAVQEEKEMAKQEMIYNYNDENMPAWARADVQWMQDRNILQGDNEGKLGLTDDKLWVIAIVARTARYLAKLMGVKM